MNDIKTKKQKLLQYLSNIESLLVAFSGGLDSSFLLACAHEVMGDRVIAVTSISPTYPEREKSLASSFTKKRGIPHRFITSNELLIPGFRENSPMRCYFCKKALCQELLRMAKEMKIQHVAHGANMDDLQDFRPGMMAAEKAGLIAPLIEAGLYKNEIRGLAKEMGLDVWEKPSSACLASRIPYGEPITQEKLKIIESAEDLLIKHGFTQCRVRHHGSIARIEVEEREISKIVGDNELRKRILEQFSALGFKYITIDLRGYRSGSLNPEVDNLNNEYLMKQDD